MFFVLYVVVMFVTAVFATSTMYDEWEFDRVGCRRPSVEDKFFLGAMGLLLGLIWPVIILAYFVYLCSELVRKGNS